MTAAQPTPSGRPPESGHRHPAGPRLATRAHAGSKESTGSRAGRQALGTLLAVVMLMVTLLLVIGFVSNFGRVLVEVVQPDKPTTQPHEP